MFDPVTATVGAMAVSGGLNYLGAREQSKAIKSAARGQEAFQNNLLDFQRQVYGEGAPFRDISLKYAKTGAETLPGLTQDVQNPTLSAGYGLASSTGLQQLSSNAATTGDPNSGPAQVAKAQFLAGLLATERDRQIGDKFRLAGFGAGAGTEATNATGTAANLMGTAGNISGNIANLGVSQGAVTGGLYGATGQTLAQLPYLYNLQQYMNQPQSSYSPSQSTGIPHYQLG
jgi:hypothetical protein